MDKMMCVRGKERRLNKDFVVSQDICQRDGQRSTITRLTERTRERGLRDDRSGC